MWTKTKKKKRFKTDPEIIKITELVDKSFKTTITKYAQGFTGKYEHN